MEIDSKTRASAERTAGQRRIRQTCAVIVLVFPVVVVIGALWAHRSAEPLPAHARADLIVVEKAERRLTLYAKGSVLRSYGIALGRSPRGPKRREGDNRTPEGRYVIDWRNPQSAFHRALHVSYPSKADVARARQAGNSPGGAIMIHGLGAEREWIGRAHRLRDWTRGCIAVTNEEIEEIEEIWRLVPDGTPIEIRS